MKTLLTISTSSLLSRTDYGAYELELLDNQLLVDTDALPADFSTDTYTIADGQLVKAPAELIAERQAAKAKTAASVEIKELRAYLTQTDYAPIKCGELGLSMAKLYPELHAERTAARARINELQKGGAE